jgi:hypothetical protein
VCTLFPLTAKSVIGTVWFAANFVEESVTIAVPLVRVALPIEAVTPEGIPIAFSLTAPNPKEFTRTVTTTLPELIVYVPLSTFTLKSLNDGAGTVQD